MVLISSLVALLSSLVDLPNTQLEPRHIFEILCVNTKDDRFPRVWTDAYVFALRNRFMTLSRSFITICSAITVQGTWNPHNTHSTCCWSCICQSEHLHMHLTHTFPTAHIHVQSPADCCNVPVNEIRRTLMNNEAINIFPLSAPNV